MTTLAIIGPGKLGLSLVRHATDQGITVHLAGKSAEHVHQRLEAAISRWPSKCPSGAPRTSLIRIHDSWAAAISNADALLEALPEDLEQKASAWRQISALAPTERLCMTGSSSLELRRIRAEAGLSRTLIGFHLFVPVHRMRVVEVVHEKETPQEEIQKAQQWGSRLGLRVISVKDHPGFAASRMALAQGLEAMRLVEQSIATPKDLDALMVIGYGHPVGPLELSDRVGLDLRLAIARQVFETTGDPVFAPPEILKKLVAQGHHGKHVGRGFYLWPQGEQPQCIS